MIENTVILHLMLRAIANQVSGKKCNDSQEVSGSKLSALFEKSDSV